MQNIQTLSAATIYKALKIPRKDTDNTLIKFLKSFYNNVPLLCSIIFIFVSLYALAECFLLIFCPLSILCKHVYKYSVSHIICPIRATLNTALHITLWPSYFLYKCVLRYTLSHGPLPKTFQKNPLILQNYPPDYNHQREHACFYNQIFPERVVCNEHFPVTFGRLLEIKEAVVATPQIIISWPAKNAAGTSSLFLDFINEEVTIPETNLSIWALFQMAGTTTGAAYWKKNACTLIPFLFPNFLPSTLNPKAPVVSLETIKALQTRGGNPKQPRAKYAFLTLMCLQFWGISYNQSPNRSTQLKKATNFQECIQNIKNRPHRVTLFTQVIVSLATCGFAPLAVQLADFLNKYKKNYDFSQDMLQPLKEVLQLESTAYAQADLQEPLSSLLNLDSPALKKYWSFYIALFPSCKQESQNTPRAPFNSLGIPLLAFWDQKNPQNSIEKASNISCDWVPVENCTFWPLKQPTNDPRPYLPLGAPRFFYSLADEEKIEGFHLLKRSFKENLDFSFCHWLYSLLFFTKHPLKQNPVITPLLEDMNHPPKLSVLPLLAHSYQVHYTPLSYNFLRSPSAIGPKIMKMESWPFLNAQYTNNWRERFFAGEVTIPGTNTDFWGFIRQGGSFRGLKYLDPQVLYAILPTKQYIGAKIPVLSRELFYKIQIDPKDHETASKYLLVVFIYLRRFGIQLDHKNSNLEKSADFARCAQTIKDNNLQMFPMMAHLAKSVAACGFGALAKNILRFYVIFCYDFGLADMSDFTRPSLALSQEACKIQALINALHQKRSYREELQKGPYKYTTQGNAGTHYLDTLPSSSTHSLFKNPQFPHLPRTRGPLESPYKYANNFEGLISWNKTTKRWDMPHLKAPPYFCIIEEQKWLASSLAKAFVKEIAIEQTLQQNKENQARK